MKKETKLNLPESCQLLDNDSLMATEGGWYIDVSQKMLLLSNKDLKNISILSGIISKLNNNYNTNIDQATFNNLINLPPVKPGTCYGIGIKFNFNNLSASKVWPITSKKEAELANSNKIVP